MRDDLIKSALLAPMNVHLVAFLDSAAPGLSEG